MQVNSGEHVDGTIGRRFHGLLTVVLALGALTLLAYLSLPLFVGEVYVEDDLRAYHIPMRTFYQTCLHEGHRFLWTPDIFNGFYIHGEGQARMLHPAIYLGYRLLPFHVAFNFEMLSSYVMLLAGGLWLLRRWQLPWPGALFGAMLLTFIGAHLNHYVHPIFVSALAHLPLQLALIDMAFRDNRPRTRVLAVAALLLMTALQLLNGFPQGTWFSWLVEMAYALVLFARTHALRVLLMLGAAKLLAMGCAAAQLLPTWDALQHSYRANLGLDFQLGISLHPLNLLQLFNPYLFHGRVFKPIVGDEPWDAPYMGSVALALAILTLAQWVCRAHRGWRVGFAAGVMALGFTAALGGYGVLYPVLALIPVVNRFRAPARYIALASFGVALLAGIGFARLAQQRGPTPWRTLAWVALAPMVSIVGTLGLHVWKSRTATPMGGLLEAQLMGVVPLLAGVGLVSFGAALVVLAGRGHRWALLAAALFTIGEIGVYSMRHKPTSTMEAVAAEVTLPPAPPPAMLDPDIHPMFMNRFGMHGYRTVYGYVSLMPERALDYTHEAPLRLAGVTWRQARVSATPGVAEAALRGETWVPLADSMPRARLVSSARYSEDPAADLAGLDIATVALVDTPLELGGGPSGNARLIGDHPGEISVAVSTPSRQLLIITERYHPGWRAQAGETALPVIPVYGDFIGVPVEAGDHRVTVTFAPDSFIWGVRLSLASIALSLALLAAALRWSAVAVGSREGPQYTSGTKV
jgi:hypothetical protein